MNDEGKKTEIDFDIMNNSGIFKAFLRIKRGLCKERDSVRKLCLQCWLSCWFS